MYTSAACALITVRWPFCLRDHLSWSVRILWRAKWKESRLKFNKIVNAGKNHFFPRTRTVTSVTATPANERCWPNAGLMLGQRQRRWPIIEPALDNVFRLMGNASCLGEKASSQWRKRCLPVDNYTWWRPRYIATITLLHITCSCNATFSLGGGGLKRICLCMLHHIGAGHMTSFYGLSVSCLAKSWAQAAWEIN